MKKIANRNLDIDMYLDDDNNLHAFGRLIDDKNVAFDSYEGGIVKPGIFHNLSAEIVVDLKTFTILDIKTGYEKYPVENCPDIASVYDNLKGIKIASGYTKKVLETAGGKKGCAHLTHLIIVMGAAIVQGAFTAINSEGMKESGEKFLEEDQVDKYFVGTCHIW